MKRVMHMEYIRHLLVISSSLQVMMNTHIILGIVASLWTVYIVNGDHIKSIVSRHELGKLFLSLLTRFSQITPYLYLMLCLYYGYPTFLNKLLETNEYLRIYGMHCLRKNASLGTKCTKLLRYLQADSLNALGFYVQPDK